MAQPWRTLGWVEREQLALRLVDITQARARLRCAQGVPGGRGVYQLRMDLVVALETYGNELNDLGAPIPRKLKAELELQRGIGHRT